MKGEPVMTMVNGKIVMEDGQVFGDEKAGRFVKRPRSVNSDSIRHAIK